jgi:hypothetical protein
MPEISIPGMYNRAFEAKCEDEKLDTTAFFRIDPSFVGRTHVGSAHWAVDSSDSGHVPG